MYRILKKTILLILSLPVFSRFTSLIVRIRRPHFLVRLVIDRYFIRRLGVNTAEAEKPPFSYPSVLAFFTRRLKRGTRPIAPGRNTVCSPVDGRIHNLGRISRGMLFQVKGRPYRLAELVPGITDDYQGGYYLTIYLSPADYHRIHHPLDSLIDCALYVPGRLLPVNEFSINNFQRVFSANKRIITCYRDLVMVKVGALNVGDISVIYDSKFYSSCRRVKDIGSRYYATSYINKKAIKGKEAAVFNLGSTIILLFKKSSFKAATGLKKGVRLKCGQKLGTIKR